MAKVTFDGVNKLIIVNPGITELDVKIDIYSDWKEWALLTDNLKFEAALRAVGGDPISDTRNLGATFFLINGWRIRPDETDHRLIISGNIFTDPAGFSPVVATVGDFNAVVEYSTSNLVDAVVSELDVERISTQVWETLVPTGTEGPVPGSYGELVQDSFSTLIAAIIAADLLVEAGSTDTVIKTGATQADSFYDGLVVVISNMAGTVARKVNLYNQADGTFTLDQALPFTPNVGDRFIVLGRIASATANIDNNAVAIAVWARSILAPTVGSYGELTNKIGNNTSVIPALL